jgi:hypothetical protein
MKLLIKYIVLVFTFLIWAVGCHPDWVRAVYQAGLIEDDYRYGDLYRLSNLAQFKQKVIKCTTSTLDTNQNLHLYIIGDSFTEPSRVDSTAYHAARYSYSHWNDAKKNIQLDTSAYNVIILQSVERHVREHFAKKTEHFTTPISPQQTTQTTPSLSAWFETLHHNLDERLESFLFSNDFFLRFKEWKATLNFVFFERTNDQVTVSPDQKHILFAWDTDATTTKSSFSEVKDSEIEALVSVMNHDAAALKKVGFNDVVISLIPNKTSIVAPQLGHYNHLIERLENHPKLHVSTVSVWQEFSSKPTQYYYLGDTHWNCKGQQLWLNKITATYPVKSAPPSQKP